MPLEDISYLGVVIKCLFEKISVLTTFHSMNTDFSAEKYILYEKWRFTLFICMVNIHFRLLRRNQRAFLSQS